MYNAYCLEGFLLNDDNLDETSYEESPTSSPSPLSISYICNQTNHHRQEPKLIARCKVPQCMNLVKRLGVCWKHGGFRDCMVPNCTNRVKARGLCWSHGGGKPCKHPKCSKTALRYGYCWAHGGGKRCLAKGCKRHAYERNQNFCMKHYVQAINTSEATVAEEILV